MRHAVARGEMPAPTLQDVFPNLSGLSHLQQVRRFPRRTHVFLVYVVSLVFVVYFVVFLSIRCMLGDIRLWVGDPLTTSCRVSLPPENWNAAS